MTNPNTRTRTLVIEKEFPHTPEKIWRALTEGHLLKQWLLDNDFEPTVGHRFQFRSPPMPQWDGIISSHVLTLEPHKKLSYTWTALGLESIVVWTLTPTPTGTHLRMEQSGFGPDQNAAYNGATYGWKNFLTKLEHLLTTLH